MREYNVLMFFSGVLVFFGGGALGNPDINGYLIKVAPILQYNAVHNTPHNSSTELFTAGCPTGRLLLVLVYHVTTVASGHGQL